MPHAEHSCVRLTRAVPEHQLLVGALGTVVHVYPDDDAYEIEFVDGATERTLAVVTLTAEDLRPA